MVDNIVVNLKEIDCGVWAGSMLNLLVELLFKTAQNFQGPFLSIFVWSNTSPPPPKWSCYMELGGCRIPLQFVKLILVMLHPLLTVGVMV